MEQPQGVSIAEIKEEFRAAKRLVAHNVKFDLCWLMHLGIDISNYRVYCTQVAEYLLRAQRVARGSLTLENLSIWYDIPHKIDKVKMFWESGYETDEIPTSILLPYCEQDCLNALAIYQAQSKDINNMGLSKLCTLQFELSKILATIEYNGMKIDTSLVKGYSEEYHAKIADCDRRLLELLKDEGGVDTDSFNLSSNEHLSAALYGGCIRVEDQETVERVRKDGSVRTYQRKCILELPLTGLGFRPLPRSECAKGGYYKTDVQTLESLVCKTPAQREFIKLIKERSRLAKLKSTYFDGLGERAIDGYIHSSFNQTIAANGRLTSSNPNSQNFPRGSTGPVKLIFISRY